MAQGIWILAETRKGNVKKTSFELLSEALRLKENKNEPIGAVLIGSQVASLAEQLYPYGAEKVYVVEDSSLENFDLKVYADCLENLLKENQPSIFLMESTIHNKELAAALAVRFKTGAFNECTGFEFDESGVFNCIRPAFAGKVITKEADSMI